MELAIATISSLLLHGILVDFSNELNQTSNQLLAESQYLLTKNTGTDTGEKRLPNEFRDFSQAIIMFELNDSCKENRPESQSSRNDLTTSVLSVSSQSNGGSSPGSHESGEFTFQSRSDSGE